MLPDVRALVAYIFSILRCALALALPQPTQAHRRPQLQRFSPLAAGNGERLLKTGFRRRMMLHRACQQQLPMKPIELRLPPTLPGVVHASQRFSEHVQSFLSLPPVPTRLGRQGQQIRPHQLCSRGLMGGQALAHLGDPLWALPLRGHRPAP
jgi:hypothetical protein